MKRFALCLLLLASCKQEPLSPDPFSQGTPVVLPNGERGIVTYSNRYSNDVSVGYFDKEGRRQVDYFLRSELEVKK